MSEQYVDWVRVRLAAYDGHPSAAGLEGLWSIEVHPDGAVDLDALIDGVRQAVEGQPFTLNETRSVTSWGASGAGVEILIDTLTAAGELAAIVGLVMAVVDRFAGHRRGRLDLADDAQVQAAILRALHGMPGVSIEIGTDTPVEIKVVARDATSLRVTVPLLDGGRVLIIDSSGDVSLSDQDVG